MIFLSPETKTAAPSGCWCFSFVYISLPALCKTHDLTQYVWAHGESCCRSRCVHVRWNTRRASKLIYTDLPLARVHLGQTLEGGWRLFRVQMRGSTSLLERSFKFTPRWLPRRELLSVTAWRAVPAEQKTVWISYWPGRTEQTVSDTSWVPAVRDSVTRGEPRSDNDSKIRRHEVAGSLLTCTYLQLW